MYQILGGVLLAVLLAFGGYKAGRGLERGEWQARELTYADKVIVQQKIVIREVPKIVTKVVTKEVQVEKEVERVVTVANHMLAPDCVLPDDYGMLLVAAANGVDPTAAGAVDEISGTYGCRAVLAATLHDLSAGWRNSARLEGMQTWAKLVTEPEK